MSNPVPGETKPKLPFRKMLWKEWIKPIGSVLLVMIVVRSSVIDWNDVPSGSMLPTIQLGDRIVVNKLAYGAQFPLSGPYLEVPFTSVKFQNPLRHIPMLRWGGGPKRGDIITFWSPNQVWDKDAKEYRLDGTRLIKRVVAVPGDTIQVVDGKVHLNGKPPKYFDLPGMTPQVEPHKNPMTQEPQPYDVSHGVEQADGTPAHRVQFVEALYSLRHMKAVTLGEDQYFCMGDDRDDSADSRAWVDRGIFISRRQITGKAVGIAWNYHGSWPSRFFHTLYPASPEGPIAPPSTLDQEAAQESKSEPKQEAK